MRIITRLSTLSVTLFAAGCLGGYQNPPQTNPPAGGAGGSQSSNQNAGGGAATPPANGGTTTPPAPAMQSVAPTAFAELVKFGKCMQQADWTAAGMDGLAEQLTDSGPCRGCHQGGMYSVYLSKVPLDNFTRMKAVPYLQKFAALSVDAEGVFKDIVPADRFAQRGQETTLNHPTYILSAANVTALQTFFTTTMTHYKAGNCP